MRLPLKDLDLLVPPTPYIGTTFDGVLVAVPILPVNGITYTHKERGLVLVLQSEV